MSGLKFLYNLILKDAIKGSGKASGIMSIGPDIRKITMNKYAKYVDSAKKQGVDLDKLSEEELKYIIELNKPKGPMIGEHRVIDATSPEGKGITESLFGKKPADVLDLSGKKIPPGSQIMGGEEVKIDIVADTIATIKSKKPIDAMKEANSVIGRKGKYKNLTPEESKKILKDTEDHIFERDIPIDPEDLADGGVAGLLGERPRQNFKMGKRAFLKFLASGAAGIAGLKTGLFGFGKKEAAKEVVKQAAGSGGQVPPYFLNLVSKIKMMGDDAPRLATKDRQKVTTYKDYTLTEDVTTGRQEIQRMKVLDDDSASYYGQPLTEETYMSYTPGETIIGKGNKPIKTGPEYDEGTALLRSDRGNAGEIVEESATISDDVIKEANYTFDKADGGRIGYSAGSKVIGKGIMAGINKLFGKGTMTTADKIKRPKKALDREMFKKADDRLNKKRQLTDEEFEDFQLELGDNLEAYNFDGTVGDSQRILKEQENYMKYMYDQYRTGKLDPVAGDKSLARKKLLEKRLEDMEASGDKRLMTRDEIEELSTFDFEKGLDDLDNMRGTKDGEAAQIKLKYPGISDDLINKILIDDNPQRKAEVLATLDESFKMMDKGMGPDDIITTFKNTKRTKQATGGLAGMLGE